MLSTIFPLLSSLYEISITIHISQPTISRDIDFMTNQTSSDAKGKDLAQYMHYEQENTLDSVGELMKNLWLISDSPKIEAKERMKAMNLMMQCQYMRLKLVDSEEFYQIVLRSFR